MPSTTSSSFCRLLPSSTVITPSLPTLSIASAMILPMSLSELAEIEPTWAISLEVLQGPTLSREPAQRSSLRARTDAARLLAGSDGCGLPGPSAGLHRQRAQPHGDGG